MQNILENKNHVTCWFLRGSDRVAVCWPIVSTWLQDIRMWHKICVLLTPDPGQTSWYHERKKQSTTAVRIDCSVKRRVFWVSKGELFSCCEGVSSWQSGIECSRKLSLFWLLPERKRVRISSKKFDILLKRSCPPEGQARFAATFWGVFEHFSWFVRVQILYTRRNI